MPDTDPMDVIRNAARAAGTLILAKMASGDDPAGAVSAIGLVLLGDNQAEAADVAAEISKGGPDLNLKLMEAEQQSLARLDRAQKDFPFSSFFPTTGPLTQTEFDNTRDARERQITLHDATNKWLAYIVTFGLFFLVMALLIGGSHLLPNDSSVRDLLFALVGVISTQWANIIGYYFGSSAGSQQKSQTLAATLGEAVKNKSS